MGDESIQLVFKALTGESLTEIKADRSSTIKSVVSRLAEIVPLPAKKSYQLVLGTDPLDASDTLNAHISGKIAELIACVESDDSSEETSSDKKKKKVKDKKAKKGKKAKKKNAKEKGKKDKSKSSKKVKGKSSSSSSAPKKKAKKSKGEPLETEEELERKSVWIKQRLDELRQLRPPMPMEQCLVRAQKEWIDEKERQDKEKAAEEESRWPPMVREAMEDAEEEARAAGKSDEQIKEEVEKAKIFALKVAKDNGLYKLPGDEEDKTKVPLFFQKRAGLDKAVSFLKKLDD